MRTPFAPLLLAVATATLPSAHAQNAASRQGPTAEQLLHVPVGGTHIPVQAQPAELKNPYEGDPSAIAQGHTLFNSMNCSGCHAAKGGGGMGPPLSDGQWIYGGRPEQIYLTIMHGRPNGMPSFAAILPPDSLWKLVAYVSTLSAPATQAAEQAEAAHDPAAEGGGKAGANQ